MHHKWNTKNEVDDAICTLKHRDIIGFTQTGGFGLGSINYSPFFCEDWRDKRDAAIKFVELNRLNDNYILWSTIVKVSILDGKNRRHSKKLTRRKLRKGASKTELFIESNGLHATSAGLSNAMKKKQMESWERWKIKTYALSVSPLAFKERYTWHNIVLQLLKNKIDLNEAKKRDEERKRKWIFIKRVRKKCYII